ncbi:hypothetical protein Cni_G08024 [Canna indica]|uniref:FYVE-type domain-containing protein n=1 Tax=Canna indica TaxID=4628 RepID=A0AAQ3JZX4_9LILI|nr:hypothetical protein Cni_G08024 [Canna indica]
MATEGASCPCTEKDARERMPSEPATILETPPPEAEARASFCIEHEDEPLNLEVPCLHDECNSSLSTSLSYHTASAEMAHDHESDSNLAEASTEEKIRRYFYYEPPVYEETGSWLPVSTPPLLESNRENWISGFGSDGGFFPDYDISWDQFSGDEKEMTMWDVVTEMLLAARGKMSKFTPGEVSNHKLYWLSTHLLDQAWKEMAHTLAEEQFENAKEILETEPPKWLPDSSASACMLCSVHFHPIMCSRHHCRFCGGLFCGECSKGRSLLPWKFQKQEPQRVCDVCYVRLESFRPYLMNQVSRASRLPTHDLTDLSTLRSWLNFPWGRSMEDEIYKATNTIRGYNKVGSFRPERYIPVAILQNAKGLAILTVAKVGLITTYHVGTGLVVARREDGSWSPPSAVSTFGAGWGAQVGGELIDFIIVLRTESAVKNFSANAHLSLGAGFSATGGIAGREAQAKLLAGDGGYAACYTYSCSKGAFVGCSLEGSVVTTRTSENCRFYGTSISPSEILLGSLPKPPAATALYHALSELFQKLDK